MNKPTKQVKKEVPIWCPICEQFNCRPGEAERQFDLPTREWVERQFLVRNILEMRFGDGSAEPNLQIELATKEVLGLMNDQKKKMIEVLEGMKVPKIGWKYYHQALSDAIKELE